MRLSERLELMLTARLTDEQSIIREAMELAKRYEDAPVGHYDTYHVYSPWYPGKGKEGEFVDWMVSMKPMNGQRVRIVLDKEGAE